MNDELNRAAETIEHQQQMINKLQEEVFRMTLLREEGSHEVAERLVKMAQAENKTEYRVMVNGVRYVVCIRERDV